MCQSFTVSNDKVYTYTHPQVYASDDKDFFYLKGKDNQGYEVILMKIAKEQYQPTKKDFVALTLHAKS